ncbi:MAG: class I SAM-dependent methyltransferase [Pseudomonadota bacterium]
MMARQYWNGIGRECRDSEREYLWRIHLQWIYRRLLNRWADRFNEGLALKTDLFDEAVSPDHLIALLSEIYPRVVGIDIAYYTATAARGKFFGNSKQTCVAVSDIRRMGLKPNMFDMILSPSTLDHFQNLNDLVVSLQETHRLLKSGGTLFITLDNPANPIVSLRNRLPYRPLKEWGIVPFQMGITLSMAELIAMLESLNFTVIDHTVIVHSPRILAIRAGQLLKKIGNRCINDFFLNVLKKIEILADRPTRYKTGYYVAVKAIKP